MALDKVSAMQSELMESETHSRELETNIDVIQSTLRQVMQDRDQAIAALKAVEEQNRAAADMVALAELAPDQLDFLSDALAQTAQ